MEPTGVATGMAARSKEVTGAAGSGTLYNEANFNASVSLSRQIPVPRKNLTVNLIANPSTSTSEEF
jgi:hypothetical protein